MDNRKLLFFSNFFRSFRASLLKFNFMAIGLAFLIILGGGVFFSGEAIAADYYVSGAGGTYAEGDASDGLTWAKAYTTIQSAITSMSGTDDDVIILDPTETFPQAGKIRTALSSKTGGSVHLKSENEDSTACIISGCTTTCPLFRHDETDVTYNLTGITFKDHTRTTGYAVVEFIRGSDLTLTDIVLDNLSTITADAGSRSVLYFDGIFTVTIDGLVIKNCNYEATSCNKGAFLGGDDSDVSFVLSDITVQDSNMTLTGDSGSAVGVIFFPGTLTLSGTNIFENINMNTEWQTMYGFLSMLGNSTLSGKNTFDNIDFVCPEDQNHMAGLIFLRETVDITGEFEVKNCDADVLSGVGMIVGSGSNAVLNITGPNASIHDNQAPGIGGIVANSQGGVLNLNKVQIYNNTA